MELDFPNEIIQHIQSFLDVDEAVRSSLLSKSWYDALSTRPIQVFKTKKYKFPNKPSPSETVEFWNYVGETMKRYKQFNIKLEKLVLDYKEYNHKDPQCSSYNVDELVADASTMGITDLALDQRTTVSHDLLLKILAIKSLTKLSVDYSGYKDRLDGKVLCSSLVSLCLHGAYGDVIVDILLGCPFIQTLDYYNRAYTLTLDDDIVLCPRLVSLTYDFVKDVNEDLKQNILLQNILFRSPFLEKLDFRYSGEQRSIPIFPSQVFAMRSFTSLSISRCKVHIDQDQRVLCSHLLSLSFSHVEIGDEAIRDILLGCPLVQNLHMKECKGISNIDVSNLDNLVTLCIQNCSTKVSFGSTNVPEFHNFSARFPRLKRLTLEHCTGFGSSVHISSHSLEYIQLYPDKELQKVVFDVPNIRKFVFETCDHLPSLSFHTTSTEWESKVKLSSSLPAVTSFWFVKLREFLNELSLSRISLNIVVKKEQLIWVKDFPWLPTPVVDNLNINNGVSQPVTHELLCALFRSCRPTFISIRSLDSYGYHCAKLLYALFLINQNNAENAKCFNKMQSLLMHDLEEIDLERSEGTPWQSTPLSKFLEDADPVFEEGNEYVKHYDSVYEEEIRLRLKWGAFRSCTS